MRLAPGLLGVSLGLADIAVSKVIPALQGSELCRVDALASRSSQRA